MNAPLYFQSLLQPAQKHSAHAAPVQPPEGRVLNESAEFLLQKVAWDQVIDQGQSTAFGASEAVSTWSSLAEDWDAPLPPQPVLKDVQVLGSMVTLTFEQHLPTGYEIPEIRLNGQRAELVVLDQDALTLGFDIAPDLATLFERQPNVNLSDDTEKVWLSTMGFALSDGVAMCGPMERPAVVQNFQLGEDQLVVTELLVDVWEPGQSLGRWLEFTQHGHDGVLRVDERGQGDFSHALHMTLEDFYRHNAHITNLNADDLRRMGGVRPVNGTPLDLPVTVQDWHAYERPTAPSPLPPSPLQPEGAAEGSSPCTTPLTSTTREPLRC